MRPIDAYHQLNRQTGGIQAASLEEEAPGVWTGSMVSRIALMGVEGLPSGVQQTASEAISEPIVIIGTRQEAKAALEAVRQADGGGVIVTLSGGALCLKGMGFDLHGKSRIPDMDNGGYK